MDYVKFGTTDYSVSRMGLGCMSMSGCYGAQDDDECIRTIHRALDLGVNFLDTSHSYGEGHNQELIGRALKGKRNSVVIHSKTGSPRATSPDDVNRGGGSEVYLRKTCEESLRRLGTDHLDILCMSRVDRSVPIEESVAAMAKMVKEGKTRHIALSEASRNPLGGRGQCIRSSRCRSSIRFSRAIRKSSAISMRCAIMA